MFQAFLYKLSTLQPIKRRSLNALIDIFLLFFVIFFYFWLINGDQIYLGFKDYFWLFISAPFLGISIYFFSGLYKGITLHIGEKEILKLTIRNLALILLLVIEGIIFRFKIPPLNNLLLLWLLSTTFIGISRFAFRELLIKSRLISNKTYIKVAIYGAGMAGAQLARSLRVSQKYKIKTFLDDSNELCGRYLNGIPINSPSRLINGNIEVDQVLLAIPSINRKRRKEIFGLLKEKGIKVLQIPSIDELLSGNSKIDKLRPILAEDILGRDSVPPNKKLLGPHIKGCIVCVTGAGGSIGSELCKKIIDLKPSRLLLIERSEINLYTIHQSLLKEVSKSTKIEPILGSANDRDLIEKLFKKYKVEIIFHAAAYKHVPLVEKNPLAGLSNNVLSTKVICEAAKKANVPRFILISTDKAVRPTNIMGASKRLSELVVQAFAEEELLSEDKINKTIFAMVRFGNVLGSSGSVVPLFNNQIASGGPLTLTHPEIIRYFMTISEAAELVLQAGVLAEGGDVFLLDMGEPVLIKNLAEQMISLSGLTIKNHKNPNGDIEIIYTGLRPGEKLYEELLIDADSQPTLHPLIFKGNESGIPSKEFWRKFFAFKEALKNRNQSEIFSLLSELVPEWEKN